LLRICYVKRKRALFVKDIVGISFDMPNFIGEKLKLKKSIKLAIILAEKR
jgi:hypothetical protein